MTRPDTRPPRSVLPLSIWVVAVALPLMVSGVAVALQLAWLPELPDPIATHWGGDGSPDGFGPVWSTTALTAGLALALTAMFAVFLATARGVAPTATHKLLAVISLSESVFIGILVTASLGMQRGLDDARDAPGLGPWIGIALAAAALVGVAAWFALPTSRHADVDDAGAEPMTLMPGERSAWIATTRLSTGGLVLVLSALGFALAASVFAVVATGGVAWPILAVPFLLFAALSTSVAWTVRVDAAGLTVRAQPFGVPRVVVPVAEIDRVGTSHVEPLAEFGGWGWRWAPGRSFGVVTRSGPAIEVVRRDGRRFTVTVDDAETGAALLAAYAQHGSR